jgi:1-acyl-sn-glycerol-3-phosphate acyltransferase
LSPHRDFGDKLIAAATQWLRKPQPREKAVMSTKKIHRNTLQKYRTLKFVNSVQRRLFDYEFLGLEYLDKTKPSILVGNHSIYAYDVAILLVELKLQKDIELRALGDRIHDKIPYWRDLLENYGVVPATPENCTQLMKTKQHILVFPGGAREALKRRGEEHRLFWKKRTGFARMALANKYPITPFFVYGADLGYDIVWDYSRMKKNRILAPLFKRKSKLNELLRDGELFPPLALGRYNTLLPKRTPIIFKFGKPISTRKYKGATDDDTLWEVRERVEEAVTQLMREAVDYLEESRREGALKASK